MFGIRFSMKRPGALAERVEQIRRHHQLRRVLAEIQLPLHARAGARSTVSIPGFNEED